MLFTHTSLKEVMASFPHCLQVLKSWSLAISGKEGQLEMKASPDSLSSWSLPLLCGAAFQVACPGSQLCWFELRAEWTCWRTVLRPVWLE